MEGENTEARRKGLSGRVKVGCIYMKPKLGTWLRAGNKQIIPVVHLQF